MAEVRPLQADAFEEVHRTLLNRLNPSIPRESWRRLFAPPWPAPEPTVGYGLYDAREGLVGFLGTLRSSLPVGGRVIPVCNLTSWTVLPRFRELSLTLLAPELRRADVTLTNMTPLAQVHQVVSKLGFRVLEAQQTVVRVGLDGGERSELVTDESDIQSVLPPHDLQVMRDHRPAGRHLVMMDLELGPCYVLYQVVRRMRLPCARLYHIGNPDAFRRGVRALHRHLFRRHGAVLLDFDSRLAGDGPVPGGRRVDMKVPRMYRSPDLPPDLIPSAYSELLLLGI
jgi:hypothetical protein